MAFSAQGEGVFTRRALAFHNSRLNRFFVYAEFWASTTTHHPLAEFFGYSPLLLPSSLSSSRLLPFFGILFFVRKRAMGIGFGGTSDENGWFSYNPGG